MAKNAAGEGKGTTKNDDKTRSVEAQNEARRNAKKRRKHSGSGVQAPTTHILAEIAKERRERTLEIREQQAVKRAQWQENIRLQSSLALVFIAQRAKMSSGERLIAEAVAKAFVDSVKTGSMSRTAVAKDKVRTVWKNNPTLQAKVTEKELNNGLRIGGADLFKAGKEVFENAPAADSKDTEEPISA